ncbi:protein Mpv17-like [Daphnia pulex]|uniref:protein Mpv17-like n=1 Tax=Daphnia pulex TaxID=6669 RepID=UPI001EDFBDB5|nr:protein Mpv17-like [Daphnia pulex]
MAIMLTRGVLSLFFTFVKNFFIVLCKKMSSISKIYKNLLHKYPYGIQAVQTAILMGTGDFLSQVFVEKTEAKDYNFLRTAKFAGFGLCVAGPAIRGWYNVLDRYIKSPGVKGVLLKVSVDQLLFAPTFLVIFLSTMGTLNGEGPKQISTRVKQDFPEILVTNWKVWPMVQMVNFYFIPLQHRVVVAQFVAVFWNTYLAFVTNRT